MPTPRPSLLAIIIAVPALFLSLCSAQTPIPYPVQPIPSGDATTPYPTKIIPPPLHIPSSSGDPSSFDRFLAYHSTDQMNQADRDLLAKSQSAIRDAAAFAAIEFENQPWSYRQLECQAVPHHLFLLFQANGGTNAASLFSVSIPRSGNGHVRVLPVERRGFSLFSPAPVNATAMATFNRIRAEEPTDPQAPPADWLAVGLCYAALTDPATDITISPRKTPGSDLALSFPPSLAIGQQGESTVRFVDVAAGRPAMQWQQTFDAKNQLIKVEHAPAPVYATRIIPKI